MSRIYERQEGRPGPPSRLIREERLLDAGDMIKKDEYLNFRSMLFDCLRRPNLFSISLLISFMQNMITLFISQSENLRAGNLPGQGSTRLQLQIQQGFELILN